VRTVALGEVASIIMGQAPPGSSYNDEGVGTPLIAGAGDFSRGRLKPTKYTTSATKLSEPGDIILSIRASIGSKVWANGKYCLGRGVAGLRASEGILAEYLWHWLTYHERVLAAKGRGATFPQVSRSDIADLTIRLPSIEVQRRIATTLDQADALRAKRRRSLALLDDLIQSAFAATFGDLWTGSTTIGDTAVIQGGLQVTRTRAALSLTAPYLRVANVHRGRLQLDEIKTIGLSEAELARTRLQADDLLFVEGHANPLEVGRVARWDGSIEDCTHQNHLIRARLDQTRCLPIYACHWLNSPKGAAHFQRGGKTTSGLNTISASTVRSAPLPLPPLHLQRAFAERAEHIDLQRARAMRSLEVLDELFASLQSRAFSGELTLSAS
jgi:type I restriction enzyme, S subunit